MKHPNMFLAATGGSWFGPEMAAEWGERKCFLLVWREIEMGSFTGWDNCGEGGSSISPSSESGGAILWPVTTFSAMSGVELIVKIGTQPLSYSDVSPIITVQP